MNSKDIMDKAHEILEGTSNKKKRALIYFITQIIQINIVFIGGILILWIYTPFPLATKYLITLLTGIIEYDLFKNFVWVRWTLWKESQ
jgi:hypothetical protein